MRRYQEGGAIQTTVHPDDVGLPVDQQRLIFAQMQMTDTGPQMQALRDAVGAYMSAAKGQVTQRELEQMKHFSAADRLDPKRAAELIRGTTEAYEKAPLTNSQMSRMMETGRDVGEIEAEQIERSYNTNGTGGRVVEHANGALEWVPNGPGDIPQPPIGDVFFDPIADEQRRIEAQDALRYQPPYRFARGGAVKKFQNGGLAAATTPVAEEEEEVAITPEEIVERTTNPGAGQTLTELIAQGKQRNIDMLRETRTNLAARRDKQLQREEQDRWLAFAQAMLAPTRTGAFGESLGVAAGNLREESARAAQSAAAFEDRETQLLAAEIAAETEYIDQMLKLSGQGATNAAKSIHGSIQTMVKPEDRNKPIAQQELVFGAMQLDRETGEWALRPLKDPDGGYFIAADRLEPARAAALIKAGEVAEQQAGRLDQFINDAYGIGQNIRNVRRAIDIFTNPEVEINTSGITAFKQRISEFLNIDTGDKTELSELQNIIAQDYLDKLSALKGNTSDRDVMIMQGISLGLGRDTDANFIQLQKMAQHYENMLTRGIRSAWQQQPQDVNAIKDLWPIVGGYEWIEGAQPIPDLTSETYDSLAPGAYFLKDDWGGQIYVKQEEPEE